MKAFSKSLAAGLVLISIFAFGCSKNEESTPNKPEPDTIAPTVVNTFPSQNATEVTRSGPFWILFSEAMNEGSVEDAVTTSPAFGYFDSWNGDTLFITPTQLLEPATPYTITIGTGARDLAGNTLAEAFELAFTTNSEQDSVAPTVISTNPANGATGVPGAQDIEITFSEPMDIWNTQNAITLSPVPDNIDFDWAGSTLIIQHSSFGSNTQVTVTVATDARDLAGNNLASQYSFSFTTAEDNTRPYLASANPANNSTGVSRDITSIRLTFSEPMDINSFDNVSQAYIDARFMQLIQTEPEFDPSLTYVTIIPAHRLLPGCRYWVSLYNVTDQAGNVIDPNPTPYAFTTSGTKSYFPYIDPNKWWYLSDGSTETREIQNYNSSTGYFEIASRDETGILRHIEKLRYSSVDNTIYHLGVADYSNDGSLDFSMDWDAPLPYIKLPVESHLGSNWSISSGGTVHTGDGDTYTLTLSGTIEIGSTTTDIPSAELQGTFKNCATLDLNVDIVVYDGDTQVGEMQSNNIMYLAPCVGLIKEIDNDLLDSTSDTTYIYNWETN